MPKVYYINGFLPNHARKIAKFWFGAFFADLELNEKNRTFDIKLNKEIDSEKGKLKLEQTIDVDYFKEYWGPQWRLYSVNNDKGEWL